MTRTKQYQNEAQAFLDLQASIQTRDGEQPIFLLSVQRDMALLELQAKQLEQLEQTNRLLEEIMLSWKPSSERSYFE